MPSDTTTVWNDMRITATPSRLRGPIAFWALAGIALLISHDAIFLAQMGPGEALTRALRTAGHEYWSAASLALAAIGLLVATAVVHRFLRLRRRARELGAKRAGTHRSHFRRLIITWARLLAVVAIGFVIQESIEHLAMHAHPLGLGALLGPEYPLALPVIGLISLISSVIVTFITGAERALLETIAAALRRVVSRAPRRIDRAPLRMAGPRIGILARAAAGRAPPRMLASAN